MVVGCHCTSCSSGMISFVLGINQRFTVKQRLLWMTCTGRIVI